MRIRSSCARQGSPTKPCTLQAICGPDRAEQEKKPSEQAGTIQAVRSLDRAEEQKKPNETRRYKQRINSRHGEPGNVATLTIHNGTRFDGTKPENYRDWTSKTRVVLSMSKYDVFGVLSGKIETIPISQ